MIGPARLPPLCSCCGGRVPLEPIAGDDEGVCFACFEESTARAVAARHADAVSDFRFFSAAWFRRLSVAVAL